MSPMPEPTRRTLLQRLLGRFVICKVSPEIVPRELVCLAFGKDGFTAAGLVGLACRRNLNAVHFFSKFLRPDAIDEPDRVIGLAVVLDDEISLFSACEVDAELL